MTHSRRTWSIYVLILLVALGARVGAAAWWQGRIPVEQRFVFGDSHSYWALAGCVARGEPYQYGEDAKIFRSPGYPVTLAMLFWLGGGEPSVFAARCWGAVWGVGAVAATMGLARLVVSPAAASATDFTADAAAIVAGLIAAVHPEAIASSVFVLSEATFALPMLLQLIAWAAAWRASESAPGGKSTEDTASESSDRAAARAKRRMLTYSLAAGAAAGLATLMRPGWLLFTPWTFVAWAFVRRPWRDTWRRDASVAVATCVGLAVVMAPWWWRNYQVAGKFVATTRQVGASLYDGLHPGATGASDMRFVPEFHERQREEDARSAEPPAGTFEERVDARMRDASVAWIKERPRRALELAGVKFVRLWNVWPNASELGGPTARLAIALAYVPLVTLAAVGAWLARRRHPRAILCLLPVGYLTSLHVVFVSSIRYRQPAIFTLSVLAALAVCHAGTAWRERRR